jgi:hypothetical protein
MRFTTRRKATVFLAGLALMCLATADASTTPLLATGSASTAPLYAPPNPVLVFVGQEPYETGGKHLMRYKFSVENSSDYPNTLFEAAPNLPPCGKNTKAAKSWVDIYDSQGKRLNGFCALGKSADLNQLWFVLERDTIPPSWVYIELTDRSTNTKYKSNLAETTQ